jgi:hypothetical protein
MAAGADVHTGRVGRRRGGSGGGEARARESAHEAVNIRQVARLDRLHRQSGCDQTADAVGVGVVLARLVLDYELILLELQNPSHKARRWAALDSIFHRVQPTKSGVVDN